VVVKVSVEGSLPVVTYLAHEPFTELDPLVQLSTILLQPVGYPIVCVALPESSICAVQTSPEGIPVGIFSTMLPVEVEL
jgi:hypothetical protein